VSGGNGSSEDKGNSKGTDSGLHGVSPGNFKISVSLYQKRDYIPQAFGSSGGQTGIGTMLVARAGFTSAVRVWAEAAAPVRARTTARVRIAVFMFVSSWEMI